MLKRTFGAIHLDDMLMNGIMKLGLFPSDPNLTSGDLFQGDLRRRGDIQAQLFDQQIIRGLAYLPRAVEQPCEGAHALACFISNHWK